MICESWWPYLTRQSASWYTKCSLYTHLNFYVNNALILCKISCKCLEWIWLDFQQKVIYLNWRTPSEQVLTILVALLQEMEVLVLILWIILSVRTTVETNNFMNSWEFLEGIIIAFPLKSEVKMIWLRCCKFGKLGIKFGLLKKLQKIYCPNLKMWRNSSFPRSTSNCKDFVCRLLASNFL